MQHPLNEDAEVKELNNQENSLLSRSGFGGSKLSNSILWLLPEESM